MGPCIYPLFCGTLCLYTLSFVGLWLYAFCSVGLCHYTLCSVVLFASVPFVLWGPVFISLVWEFPSVPFVLWAYLPLLYPLFAYPVLCGSTQFSYSRVLFLVLSGTLCGSRYPCSATPSTPTPCSVRFCPYPLFCRSCRKMLPVSSDQT